MSVIVSGLLVVVGTSGRRKREAAGWKSVVEGTRSFKSRRQRRMRVRRPASRSRSRCEDQEACALQAMMIRRCNGRRSRDMTAVWVVLFAHTVGNGNVNVLNQAEKECQELLREIEASTLPARACRRVAATSTQTPDCRRTPGKEPQTREVCENRGR